MSLHALILAAGRGSRFGDEPKQLARVAGKSLLQRALELVQFLTPNQVNVVLGYEHLQLQSQVESARILVNPQWQRGLGNSIAFGVTSLPTSASAVLIYLCDQAALTQEDLARLYAAYDETNRRDTIVCAAYGSSLGVPAIFPRSYFPALMTLDGDRGAKSLLLNNPVVSIAMETAAIDIDTRQQWIEFTANFIATPENNEAIIHEHADDKRG